MNIFLMINYLSLKQILNKIIQPFNKQQTMFPSVTAKEQPLKERLKQRRWDQRFGTKGGIPQYSPLKDRHTSSYRKLLNSSVTKQKYESAPNRGQQARTYFQKKVQLFDQLKTIHPMYLSHLQEFQDFLTSSKIPNSYVYYSVLPLAKQVDVNGSILKTCKAIKEKNSGFQRINAAIKARQQCLISLKNIISQPKGQSTKMQDKKDALRQSIRHYRTLTANVIDQIKRWRDALNLTQQKAIYYSEDNQNYLIKMLNDNQYIFSSELAQFINFGQKNDPFIIAPLKKTEGKQSSEFLAILQTQKNIAYYQKYMEYLASQKAYELSLLAAPNNRKQQKYPEIEKIYKSKSIAKFDSARKEGEQDQNEADLIHNQKMRQQRLKKNQQRINVIKSVYQSYSNKIKLKQMKKEAKRAETDVQDKTRKQKSQPKHKDSQPFDDQFDKMVRMKFQKQKNKKLVFMQNTGFKETTKSLTKLPKTQDTIHGSLRYMQSTLKSKLNLINEESKKQEHSLKKMGLSGDKFYKKNNEALISQLKSQIIRNLQIEGQQRQIQRSKRRMQEQKAIQQMKTKMKRQMEQKLQQRKRQKLIQRQQLQKKLREEEQRLNRQRQLQLQLQIKLAKERQLRELERVKRQSLQKQKQFKEQLQKQQKLRRQREEDVLRERMQKEKALDQLRKKELKEQLQHEIKQQMKNKYSQNPRLQARQQIDLLHSQKQHELSKQIELSRLKQNLQIEQISRQNELRERMIKLKRQQEELKRKQVQHLMKSVIQQQKQALHRQTLKKRIQLQEQIKVGAKQRLLEQYRTQRQELFEKTKIQKERKLEQDVYRQKIKEKIQKELRMQAIQRTKNQMDDRQARRYEMNVKMQNSMAKFNEGLQQDGKRGQIQAQVKRQVIQRVIYDKEAVRQSAKNDLRAQFERQLMGSSIPQNYQQNQSDPIMKKNIQKMKSDDYLKSKLNYLEAIRPTNQKANQGRQETFNSIYTQSSPKKQMARNGSLVKVVTNEEMYMYEKKKNRPGQISSQPSYKLPARLLSEQGEGFELVSVEKDDRDSEFDVRVVRKSQARKSQNLEKQFSKKKPRRIQQVDSEEQDRMENKRKIPKNNPKKKYQSEEEDSQDRVRISPSNNKVPLKRPKQSDQPVSSESDRYNSKKQVQLRRSQAVNKNETRRSQGILRNQSIKKSQKQSISRRSAHRQQSKAQKNPVKVYYDAQVPRVADPYPSESKIQIRPNKHSVQSKYEVRLEAIPEGQLDQYLAGHYEQLPQIQKLVQMFNREQLYRKLINELTFCMLLGFQNSVVIGMAFAYHDRNKTDVRKFQIVHFSAYHNQHLKDFLVSCVNYIFQKDPADQIQFHYKFDQSIQEQMAFSTDFNKWFDKYGNVYQKKVDQNIYQRKYVFKRQFNQKCEVLLGGINKNTFRNIFSVNCGVIMSDSDMIQFKDQLRNVLTPQNQISYSIAMAQLFRTYLTPDQAQLLKAKVKQFAKLKQLLILVVMLQKKKVKMEELKLSEYKNIIQLNMKLMSQGKDVVRFCKDGGGADMNRIYYAQLSQAFNMPFNFQTTSLPIQSQQTNKVHQISYFRLSPLPPNKLHIIKSSLYNTELHILPTQSSKYKLFVINAQEYNQIKGSNHLDIFMYVRLFLKNVKSHNTASWKYVWLPQMTDKANYSVRQFKSFLKKDIYCHDSINISYKEFLPNALIIEPDHKDLVITPPFIVGIMSMALQQVTEGSPLYARMIDVPALRTLQIQD